MRRSLTTLFSLLRTTPVALLAFGVACAPLRNTPEQDVAWQRWYDCRAQAPHANLITIDPSGRIRFEFSAAFERDAMLGCLRSRDASGPVLPEPVAEGQRRGP